MSFFDEIGLDIGYVLLGTMSVIVVLLVFIIILFIKQKRLNRKYYEFMKGATGESLETVITDHFDDIKKMKEDIENGKIKTSNIEEMLLSTYQKIGIIKYDAFKEMGGKLSFALALLTSTDDGFIINSMHSSREGCYTYVKEIIKGESYVLLAEEEKEALEAAKKNHNYME